VTTKSRRDRIFISYRRSDTRGYAGRLDDTLKGYFGKDRVFRDVGGIDAGEDFVRKIDTAMGDAGALIVLIGANWLAPGANGKPRLHDAGDHVAAEIGAALKGSRAIFPVLVEGASMPREEDLPPRPAGRSTPAGSRVARSSAAPRGEGTHDETDRRPALHLAEDRRPHPARLHQDRDVDSRCRRLVGDTARRRPLAAGPTENRVSPDMVEIPIADRPGTRVVGIE
jgi:hypothetical protein